eukprot:SAG31_NODE_31973_length_361_cov_1.564885_1_plen_48_part_01
MLSKFSRGTELNFGVSGTKTSMFGVWVRLRSWSEIEGRKDLDMVRNAF